MFVGNRGGYKKNFYKERDPSAKGGLTVEVRNNDVNKALRKLKKKLQAEGTLQEYRDRQYYVKPSEKRRLAKKAGKKRWLKKLKCFENIIEKRFSKCCFKKLCKKR